MKTYDAHERALLITKKLSELQNVSFEWGKFDCHLFAADVVQTYTDIDYAESFRGTYDTDKAAYRIVTQAGGSVKLVSDLLKSEPRPVLFARVGDVMAYKNSKDMIAIGICVGARAAFISKSGLEFREIGECLCSWKVE